MSALHTEPLAYTELKGFSPLFQAYCYDFTRVKTFYDGDFRVPEVRKEKALEVEDASHPREELAHILLRQQEVWGLDAITRTHIEALRQPETLAIVTGQQIGLFGGPLYTLYKAITTVQLAHLFAQELQRPVVPVFWLEDEDHDFEEIASTYILHRHEPVRLSYLPSNLPENPGAVGRLKIDPSIQSLFTQLETLWRTDEQTQALLNRLRESYRPGTSLRGAFVRWMKTLLPESGLIFLSPDDPEVKQLCLPLFRKALKEEDALYTHLVATFQQLKKANFHVQVAPRRTNFFLLTPEGRYALERENGTYRLKGTHRTFSREALLEHLEQHPEQFSPNVILRPLTQDFLLPTLAYVAGPSEIAYFAQFKPLYRHLSIPMPLLYPRASVTLIEPSIRRILEKYDLEIPELQGDVEALYRHIIVERYAADIEKAFTQAAQHIRHALDALLPLLSSLDPTLVPSAEASEKRMTKELEKLKGKVIRAEKQKHAQVLRQLQQAQNHLFPLRKLQERVLSSLYFLHAINPELPSTLLKALPTETCMHQLVYL